MLLSPAVELATKILPLEKLDHDPANGQWSLCPHRNVMTVKRSSQNFRQNIIYVFYQTVKVKE